MEKVTAALTAVLFTAVFVVPMALCATDIDSDKAAIKAERSEMKEHAQAAKAEEKAARVHIKEVAQSGDKEEAKILRQDLRKTHRENVEERHQDKKNLHSAIKEVRQDRVAARRSK